MCAMIEQVDAGFLPCSLTPSRKQGLEVGAQVYGADVAVESFTPLARTKAVGNVDRGGVRARFRV